MWLLKKSMQLTNISKVSQLLHVSGSELVLHLQRTMGYHGGFLLSLTHELQAEFLLFLQPSRQHSVCLVAFIYLKVFGIKLIRSEMLVFFLAYERINTYITISFSSWIRYFWSFQVDIGHFESNESYLLPWELQQRAQQHYLVEQTPCYRTPFFNSHHQLYILTSNEQYPACHAYENQCQWR